MYYSVSLKDTDIKLWIKCSSLRECRQKVYEQNPTDIITSIRPLNAKERTSFERAMKIHKKYENN